MQQNRIKLLAVLLVVCVGLAARAADGPAAKPYRRLIEAEWMTIEGGAYKPHDNPYCSNGSAVLYESPAAGADKSRLVVPLEKTLPAGRYLVWVLFYLDAADARLGEPLQVRATLGETASVGSVTRDGSAWLNARVIVDAAKPFDSLSLAVVSKVSHVLLDRVYISAEVTDFDLAAKQKDNFAIGSELIRRESLSTKQTENEPANWIDNGSFEVGLPTFDWSTPYQSSNALAPQMWSDRDPADGQRCLRVPLYPQSARFLGDDPKQPTSLTLMHRLIRLQPMTTYIFRGLFQADAKVGLQVWIDPAYPDRDQPSIVVGRGGADVTGKWQPITLTFTTPNNSNGYTLTLFANAPGPATLGMDSLTLTEKKIDGFVPSQPIEAGVHWDAPGRVFYADEPANFTLLTRFASENLKTMKTSVRVRVVDYFDRPIYDRTFDQTCDASNKTISQIVNANVGQTGSFRLLIDGVAHHETQQWPIPPQEYTFCILRRPPNHMQGTLGSYITLANQPIEIMSRAGIRSTTTLSCSNELLQTWQRMEPERGKFVWADQRVAFARAHDVKIIGNLDFSGSEPSMPDWALNPKDSSDVLFGGDPRGKQKFSRAAWVEFVEAVTRHYKDTIQDWLILDEPYHTITVEDYAAILAATYPAAKRGNPNCRIIAHGGYYEPWLPALEKLGSFAYFDGISDYSRDPTQGGRLRKLGAKHNKFVLTVDYEWNASQYRELRTVQTDWDRQVPWYQMPTQVSMTRALQAMCWAGATGFKRYDARFPGGDMTQLDLYKSLFELDGSLKPAGVAFAVAAGLLDGFHGVDVLALNTAFDSNLFEDDTRFVFAITTAPEGLLAAKINLPAGVTLLDFMGNPVDTSATVILSNAAHYLVGPLNQLDAVKGILRDLKPTSAVRIETQTSVDPQTKQSILEITVHNERADKPVTCTLSLPPEIVRDFWQSVWTTPPTAPGGKTTMRVGLNLYQGIATPRRDAKLEYYVDGGAASLDIHNVFATPVPPAPAAK